MIIAKRNNSGTSDFKLPPSGSFLARLYRIIDLGTQTTEWMGKKKMQRKVLCMFELHGEDNDGNPLVMDDGKPMVVSKRYTLSLDEKATLLKDLQAWRGKEFTQEELDGFSLEVLLGKFCMVSITHSEYQDKTYANIASISQVPAALKKLGEPVGVNETLMFSIDPWDREKFDKLSQGLQDLIKKSAEYRNTFDTAPAKQGATIEDDNFDDIPFN